MAVHQGHGLIASEKGGIRKGGFMNEKMEVIKYMQEEIDILKARINKAIEYIENCGINKDILETCKNYDVNGIDLLNILRGNNEK